METANERDATPDMVDLHCHILPGLDDGPAQIVECMAMCHQAITDGRTDIVATPHVFDGIHEFSLARRDSHIHRINMSLRQCGYNLTIHPGAEVRLVPGLHDIKHDLHQLCLNGSRYMLIELPPVFPASLADELFRLRLRGIVPMLAHPERYDCIQQHPDMLAPLVSKGVLTQITAQSLLGDFGEDCQRCAEQLIHNHTAHVVASDAHSATSRPPLLSKARERVGQIAGVHEAQAMFEERPTAVLNNQPVGISTPPLATGRTIAKLFARLATLL